VIELTHQLRRQIFNLGYYTWVEQQEVSVEDFERRRFQSFWDGIADSLPKWDRLIDDFNAEVSGSNKLDTASKARS
jgi:cysteine synthase